MSAGTIPLADLGRLAQAARRTWRLRILAAAAAILAAVLAVVAAGRMDSTTTPFLPKNTNAIVVLDVSASISNETYSQIAATLTRLARSGGRYGLVLFSDTAYQALPPGTSARELGAFARFFVVPTQAEPGRAPTPPANPWSKQFSAGTRISTGLRLALDIVRARGLDRTGVILVSDLDDDAGDIEALTSTALDYRKLGVPLRVVGLDPAPQDQRLVERLVAKPGDLRDADEGAETQGRVDGSSPATMVSLALAAAGALALLVLLTERLRWEEA